MKTYLLQIQRRFRWEILVTLFYWVLLKHLKNVVLWRPLCVDLSEAFIFSNPSRNYYLCRYSSTGGTYSSSDGSRGGPVVGANRQSLSFFHTSGDRLGLGHHRLPKCDSPARWSPCVLQISSQRAHGEMSPDCHNPALPNAEWLAARDMSLIRSHVTDFIRDKSVEHWKTSTTSDRGGRYGEELPKRGSLVTRWQLVSSFHHIALERFRYSFRRRRGRLSADSRDTHPKGNVS
jgi:hypothetical protein